MAIPTVKSTYSLDVETVAGLEEIARLWGVTKSEALRRAIRTALRQTRAPEGEAVKAFEELQASLRLSRARAGAWAGRVRAERRVSSARRQEPPGYKLLDPGPGSRVARGSPRP